MECKILIITYSENQKTEQFEDDILAIWYKQSV